MGTNYYTDGEKPCECCGRGGEELHIGKSSGGWQFLFAPYPALGLTSWKAWREFLATRAIRDEYGTSHTMDDFADLVDSKQKGGLNAQNASVSQCGPYGRDRETSDEEGYRFASDPDFS